VWLASCQFAQDSSAAARGNSLRMILRVSSSRIREGSVLGDNLSSRQRANSGIAFIWSASLGNRRGNSGRLRISGIREKIGSSSDNQGFMPGTVSLMRYTLVLAVM
jgi:hypothetical protein